MKRRILLGLLPLILLLLAVGVYAVVLFQRLGGAVDVILRENYRSVVAAQNMKEAVERMDSGALFTLAGEEERGRLLFRSEAAVFHQHLLTEQGNITLRGEGDMAAELARLEAEYAAKAASFFATEDLAARRQRYFAELLPVFTRIKDTAQAVLELNQANMLRADEQARGMAASSGRYMVAAMVLGTLGALFFSHRLQRGLLAPIGQVTSAARELGEGNYDQVVPVATRDELGAMADAFNKMAGKLRAYRQLTDEKLLRARQATQETFSALPDPILVLNGERQVEFQNPAATRLLAELEGGGLPEPIKAAAARVLKGEGDYLPENFTEVVCVRVQERETFLLPRMVGLRDASGAVSAAAILLQDVTRLRLLDDVKSNLVSTVSHELKTPLTSVRMGLHLLLEEKIGPLNPPQAELLLAAREDAERLLRMINDLLDLARLESGSARVELQPVAAADLLAAARVEAETLAGQRGLHVVTEAVADLGTVMAEPRRLAHVFTNLLSNAAKHSPVGGEITLRARAEGESGVRFSVADRGPGIPRALQGRIFERFFRVPGDEQGGAGLGLAIAREIVAAHGGHIGVEMLPSGGSEFYFVLPWGGIKAGAM